MDDFVNTSPRNGRKALLEVDISGPPAPRRPCLRFHFPKIVHEWYTLTHPTPLGSRPPRLDLGGSHELFVLYRFF